MNKGDIGMTSVCGIVQYLYGSAGCRYASNCTFCRFREFRDAYDRVRVWVRDAKAIIGCLLTWGDENDSEIAVDHPEVYDLIVKARVLERTGSQVHAQCAHMQTLCTHEPANEPMSLFECNSCGWVPSIAYVRKGNGLGSRCELHAHPDKSCDGVLQHKGLPVREILDSLKALADFAYEQGFHEIGYDPVQEIENVVKQAEKIGAFTFIDAKNRQDEPASKWRYET